MKSHFYDNSLAGVYEAAGGLEAFRRISLRFHKRIERDPILSPFFPKDMTALEERLALYLMEIAGGAPDYTATRGKTSLFCRHAHLPIGVEAAERWIEHMAESLRELGLGEDIAGRLLTSLTETANTLGDPFDDLYHLPVEGLLVKLQQDPMLAKANDRGRNLICPAAIEWDVPRLRLLLEFGADVETKDTGGHNAIYRVANGSGNEEKGCEALKLLIKHGAKVNQVTGVGGMTPLHMSARRGTTKIAETLLNAGAMIDARDKNGETPLRRAVNCGQESMVRLLISRGANPHAEDKKGRTPMDAVRSEAVRRVMESGRLSAMIAEMPADKVSVQVDFP